MEMVSNATIWKMQSVDKTTPTPQGTMLLGPLSKKGVSLIRYRYKATHTSTMIDHAQTTSLVLLLNISGHAHVSYHPKEKTNQHYHLPIAPQKIVLLTKKKGMLLDPASKQ